MNSELNQNGILEAEVLGIQNVAQTDHSKLDNLDYEHSGHTGFAPAGNYVEDANYTHTDNNYTTEEKTKLSNLENYDDTEIKRDIQSLEDTKVDKEVNKGLSTNDYTTEEKNKLGSLENYDDTQVKADIISLSTNKADKSEIPDVSDFITKNVNDLTYYTLATSTGSTIDLEINSSTYVMTLSLKNSAGTVISADTIDLPLESVVVSGSYDSTNKKIVLTLQSGSTIDIPVGDLVSGLQTEITSSNKLSADLVDDTNSTNKLTNATEKSTWNAKYDKPSGGIPSTDMSSAVQTSLGKADTAIQDISGKQDVLVSGTNIKTINSQSILGSGDITISGGGGLSINLVNRGQRIYLDELTPGIYICLNDDAYINLANREEDMSSGMYFAFGYFVVLKSYSDTALNEPFIYCHNYEGKRVSIIKNTYRIGWGTDTATTGYWTPQSYVDDSIASAIGTALGGSY